MGMIVDVGVPYTGWPVRKGTDYAFGSDFFSDQLIKDLEAWARSFNHLFDETTGWPSNDLRKRHHEQGEVLAERVRDELGPGYEVQMVAM